MNEIIRLFPQDIQQHLIKTIDHHWFELEEIRLRLNQPIELIFTNEVKWLNDIILCEKNSLYLLNQITDHSLYRMEKELREGFVTIKGGHRIGLAGGVTTKNGHIQQIQDITFFNIRVAKELKDIAYSILPYLNKNKKIFSTIIIGPPQTGKTSLIRDLARLLSNGTKDIRSHKVAIIDERSEIAASLNGIPQHDIGLRTDVMDACPKTEGMMMMIRSMSPEVLIVDEIGSKADVNAILEAVYAGVNVICTLHGQSLEQIKKRPSIMKLFNNHIFKRFIILEKRNVSSFNLNIYDDKQNQLYCSRRHKR